MRLWVFKRHFSTIFHLYGGGNDIKDMKMLFITIQTENLERNKNELNKIKKHIIIKREKCKQKQIKLKNRKRYYRYDIWV